jgi:hypothetical protein
LLLAVAAQSQLIGGYTALPTLAAATSVQWHAQDELGQASFGYAYPGQAAANYRDFAGNMVGTWAYINPNSKQVHVSYTADHRGFRVLSNDLPVAPVANLVAPVQVQDAPDVAKAKIEHAAAIAAAKATAPVRTKRQIMSHVSPFAFNYPTNAPFFYNHFGAGASPLSYTVPVAATPIRQATLTKTILTPGHAVSYRVD